MKLYFKYESKTANRSNIERLTQPNSFKNKSVIFMNESLND